MTPASQSDMPQADMPLAPHRPSRALPDGACDTHIHMLADDAAFPLWENRVEDPAPGRLADWLARYRAHADTLGIARTVVVHSILYGADNAVTKAAVAGLGRDRARGIGLLRDGAPETELDALAEAGIVGLRLNYVHGGVLSFEGAQALAPALAERGMHLQMLMHSHLHMAEIADAVRALPVPVCFDHLGWPETALGVEDPGFQSLCALLAEGKAWLKLSGSYRLSRDPAQVAPFARAALAANAERCLWGSDWPHIMLADATRPNSTDLLEQLFDWTDGCDATLRQVLVTGPQTLYGF